MKQLNKLNSIAVRLISGFMVVIVLIIALGVVSYNSSSTAMTNSYKQNMAGTVNTTSTYLELGLSQVSAEAQKIIDNSDFYNYYRGAYKNDRPHEYMDALVTTINLFNTINKHIEDLADNLDDITRGIEQMSIAKDETLSAIQSISDVSDRAAASTSQVSSTIVNQMDAVKNLNDDAETLNNNSRDLMDAVTQFKLN